MKMRKSFPHAAVLAGCAGLWATGAYAAPLEINVGVDRPGARINPHFYGLMTEEINHAYDGGLYGELLQNRSFRDDDNKPVHWSVVTDGGGAGTIALDKTGGVNAALNASLKFDVTAAGTRVGVANDGFWGIPVRPNTMYRVSFWAKATNAAPLSIGLESNDGKLIFARQNVTGLTPNWKKFTATLKTGALKASLENRFVISTNQPGTVWLSFVSLFPPTYNNRPNGNRIDLMQRMAAMKPAFLRFPGGNYVDPGHYEWKQTIGPLEQRPVGPGAWNYRSSYGLGILEFLQWCEELKMEPLLAVTDGRPWLPAEGDVTPLVQDALDEIEYVSGGIHTKWGARRAADGHPAPFALRYVEIGNEDFFDKLETYDARFAKFYDAIRAKYPLLQIIATRGDLKSRRPDIVDDHIYASASVMMRDSHNYDNYDRKAPKIFVGEWATTEGSPTPTLRAALSDAAYLTGLERNADIVTMACYAPLLVNVNPGARQWDTNLIGYDALNSYGSPSYWMQVMFNNNRGDVVLPVALTNATTTAAATVAPHGAVGVGTWSTQAEFKDAKVTRGAAITNLDATAAAWKKGAGDWKSQDGALVQSSDGKPAQDVAGDTQWTDYTYSVKARKTGGAEGFLILFHVQDNDNLLWWNIGGWGNVRSALQRKIGGETTDFGPSTTTVETGRWYDIRVEVKGHQIRGFIDDKLVVDATEPAPVPNAPIYASASREFGSNDIILKVVNVDAAPQTVRINLQGARRIARFARSLVMSGEPADVNSIAEPGKVAPKRIPILNAGKTFERDFPAHSVTVIRLSDR